MTFDVKAFLQAAKTPHFQLEVHGQEAKGVSLREKPVILYLVTEDWYFLSHRLPMANAAKDAGYEVHVATHVTGLGANIKRLGFGIHHLDWRRGSLNPIKLLAMLAQIRRIYRTVRPDLVHHVALQPCIVGSIASIGLPFPRLNAFAGLGFSFTSGTLKARLIRPILSLLLRSLLNRSNATVLVQNPDDRAEVVSVGVPEERIFLIAGSGVDTNRLKPLPEPKGRLTAAFVGRLLEDKGIRTLIESHDLNLRRGENIDLLIAGVADPANPTSVQQEEIENWKMRPGISVLGFVDDISKVWQFAHFAVLPSRREGLPKSLLEASACGRAIVATDVPGCREIARSGINALLVPPDNPVALADAIVTLARDAQLRREFAEQGRRIVEREFSDARIGKQIVSVYDQLLGHKKNLLPQTGSRG